MFFKTRASTSVINHEEKAIRRVRITLKMRIHTLKYKYRLYLDILAKKQIVVPTREKNIGGKLPCPVNTASRPDFYTEHESDKNVLIDCFCTACH